MSNPRKIVFANAILAMKYNDELREIGEIMRIEWSFIHGSKQQDHAELLHRTAVRIKVKHLADQEEG